MCACNCNYLAHRLWTRQHLLQSAVELSRREFWRPTISNTFPGRDIFAPVAAQLANGRALSEVGEPIVELVRLNSHPVNVGIDRIEGRVVTVDHFGKAITNLPSPLFAKCEFGVKMSASINSRKLDWLWCETYGNSPLQTPLALLGSTGYLELAVNCGSAASEFQTKAGDKVSIEPSNFHSQVIPAQQVE